LLCAVGAYQLNWHFSSVQSLGTRLNDSVKWQDWRPRRLLSFPLVGLRSNRQGDGFVVAASISNKDQSNSAKGGIAVASLPNSSFVFARWQRRTDGLACFGWGSNPQISPYPGGSETPSNTMCHWTPQVSHAKWHLNPSNSFICRM